MNITYFQVTGTPLRPRDQLIIAMAADYVTNVNFGFEQFATAAGIYAATNPLWPRITFQVQVFSQSAATSLDFMRSIG